MKKLLVAVLLIGGLSYGVIWLTHAFNDIEMDVNTVQLNQDRERNKTLNETPTASSPSISGHSGNAASVSGAAAETSFSDFICQRDIDAYNPYQPSQRVGKFFKGSKLKVGSIDPASGMYRVRFQPPIGKEIVAFCRAQDVGH